MEALKATVACREALADAEEMVATRAVAVMMAVNREGLGGLVVRRGAAAEAMMVAVMAVMAVVAEVAAVREESMEAVAYMVAMAVTMVTVATMVVGAEVEWEAMLVEAKVDLGPSVVALGRSRVATDTTLAVRAVETAGTCCAPRSLCSPFHNCTVHCCYRGRHRRRSYHHSLRTCSYTT